MTAVRNQRGCPQFLRTVTVAECAGQHRRAVAGYGCAVCMTCSKGVEAEAEMASEANAGVVDAVPATEERFTVGKAAAEAPQEHGELAAEAGAEVHEELAALDNNGPDDNFESVRTDMVRGFVSAIEGGSVRIYSGPVPATADDPADESAVLARGQLSPFVFAVAEAKSRADAIAERTGKATFVRLYAKDGECCAQCPVCDKPGECGLRLDSIDIVEGKPVNAKATFAVPLESFKLSAVELTACSDMGAVMSDEDCHNSIQAEFARLNGELVEAVKRAEMAEKELAAVREALGAEDGQSTVDAAKVAMAYGQENADMLFDARQAIGATDKESTVEAAKRVLSELTSKSRAIEAHIRELATVRAVLAEIRDAVGADSNAQAVELVKQMAGADARVRIAELEESRRDAMAEAIAAHAELAKLRVASAELQEANARLRETIRRVYQPNPAEEHAAELANVQWCLDVSKLAYADLAKRVDRVKAILDQQTGRPKWGIVKAARRVAATAAMKLAGPEPSTALSAWAGLVVACLFEARAAESVQDISTAARIVVRAQTALDNESARLAKLQLATEAAQAKRPAKAKRAGKAGGA